MSPTTTATTTTTTTTTTTPYLSAVGIVALWIAIAVGILATIIAYAEPPYYHFTLWAIAQWMPAASRLRHSLELVVWTHWEEEKSSSSSYSSMSLKEDIPTVNVQEHLPDNLLPYLETTFGKDWRRRPLLLKNLWTQSQLKDDQNQRRRRISLNGLLQENLVIPYFTNATTNALTPNDKAPVKDIVANILRGGPQKIGTQLLVQAFPELISEVSPTDILTTLYGDYFQPHHVRGRGPFGLFPALTTVPVFVASGSVSSSSSSPRAEQDNHFEAANTVDDSNDNNDDQRHRHRRRAAQAYTALHCEPIGNVAVQLSGRKKWLLVQPEYSFLIRPSTSPDGRAFFASWSRDDDYMDRGIPTYTAITQAGDAIWVPVSPRPCYHMLWAVLRYYILLLLSLYRQPLSRSTHTLPFRISFMKTWTWHRVDYIESEEIAIG
jgi:hypothetical protein